MTEPRMTHLADWLDRAHAVTPSERARMLEPVESQQTATDPVAAKHIDRTTDAMDALQAVRVKLSKELTRLAASGGLTVEAAKSLTSIETELLGAIVHARHEAYDLAAWAATAGRGR